MKTNSKEVREQIRKHILECVNNPETDQPFSTLEEAKERVKSEFNMVANYPYNLKRLPNTQERFSDYLLGIPFNFEYSIYEIQQYLNSLGINPEGRQFDEDKSLKLYHYLIFREVFN